MPSREFLLGIITTAALALAGFSLQQTYEAHADIATLKEQLSNETNHRLDSYDRQFKMMWAYTGWLHYQVNDLRSNAGLPVAVPPDLSGATEGGAR